MLVNKVVKLHNDVHTLRILASGILYALGIHVLVLSGFRLMNYEVVAWVHAVGLISGAALGTTISSWTHRPTRANVLVWLGLAIICFAIAGALWDTSWDGTGYHLPSVIYLSEGQNPLDDASIFGSAIIYTHAVYMWQSAISTFFGSYEVAKVTHALLIFVALSGLLELVTYLKGKKINLTEVIFCYAIVLNPIVTGQIFTFYLDSPLYLTSLILLTRLFMAGSSRALEIPAALFFSVVLLINIKLSGIYFAGALCSLYLLYAVWKRRSLKRISIISLLGGLVGVCFVGYSPYVTQTVEAGTPFFLPVDEMSALQRPKNLDALSSPERLAYSVFAQTEYRRLQPVQLKFPVWVEKSEIYSMGSPDARIGGFGPFFALEFILFFAVTPWVLLRRGLNREAVPYLIFMALGFIVICAVFPEPWWARYVPLLWAAPLLVGLAWHLSGAKSRAISYVISIGLILAGTNTALAFFGNLARTVKGNLELSEVIELARHSSRSLTIIPLGGLMFPVYLQNPMFHVSLQERFERAGLRVTLHKGDDCGEIVYVFHHVMRICIP